MSDKLSCFVSLDNHDGFDFAPHLNAYKAFLGDHGIKPKFRQEAINGYGARFSGTEDELVRVLTLDQEFWHGIDPVHFDSLLSEDELLENIQDQN